MGPLAMLPGSPLVNEGLRDPSLLQSRALISALFDNDRLYMIGDSMFDNWSRPVSTGNKKWTVLMQQMRLLSPTTAAVGWVCPMVLSSLKLATFFLSLVLPYARTANTIYFIRHAEKPKDGGNGLSERGIQRAQCIKEIFADRDIGFIIAQLPPGDGSGTRSYQTVEPLASHLGLTVDQTCTRNESYCAADVAWQHMDKNILISWQHSVMTNISEHLGAPHRALRCHGKDYDLIWTLHPDRSFTVESELCPGLDIPADDDDALSEASLTGVENKVLVKQPYIEG